MHETDFSHGCVLLFGPSLHTQGCTAGPDKLLLNQGDLLRGIVNWSGVAQSGVKGPLTLVSVTIILYFNFVVNSLQ